MPLYATTKPNRVIVHQDPGCPMLRGALVFPLTPDDRRPTNKCYYCMASPQALERRAFMASYKK